MKTAHEAQDADTPLILVEAIEYGAKRLYYDGLPPAKWLETWESLKPHERWYWRLRAARLIGIDPLTMPAELMGGNDG